MIPVTPPPEPEDFDRRTRQPGLVWLRAHLNEHGCPPAGKRPPDKWSGFKTKLAEGFNNRCGYSAMYLPDGTVDHYLSWKNHPQLAYEWDNYRYTAGWINAGKGTLDDQVLDPFVVEDNWFKIILPSLQLVLTDNVPDTMRAKAEFTVEKLHLRDDERIIRQRRQWYELYCEGKLTLAGLYKVAPLIAKAVQEQTRG